MQSYTDYENGILFDACKNAEAVVVKVIRIAELQDLLPLYANPNYDLRVILLSRNPTTMFDSRLRLWKGFVAHGWLP